MTDKVIPSVGSGSDGYIVARLIQYAGGSDGWIQESANALLADNDGDLNQTAVPLNAFNHTASDTGSTPPDVTIDTGEGFVSGAWTARDTTTLVDLASSTTGQKVYLGWDHNATETVKIGLSGAFQAEDPKMHIWTFDTGSSSVTASYDYRKVGRQGSLGIISTDPGSKLARYILNQLGDAIGTPGNSKNEVLRGAGGISDLVMSIEDSTGRMNLAYNAALYDSGDGSGVVWRYIAGSSPAMRLTFDDGVKIHIATGGTAGNQITWKTYHFDMSSGDLFGGAAKLFDFSAGNVPQAQLGGPSASLTSYPLPPGDLDDGSGSGLDADLLDGKHANQISGSSWSILDTYSDTDSTTTFNYDSGTMTTYYDFLKAEGMVYTHYGSNDWNELYCRLNGEATSNYDSVSIDPDSEVIEQNNQTHFENIAKVRSGYSSIGTFELTIRGGKVPGAATGERHPTVMCESAGHTEYPQLENGTLTFDYPVVERVQLYSPRVMTGKLRLLGKDL